MAKRQTEAGEQRYRLTGSVPRPCGPHTHAFGGEADLGVDPGGAQAANTRTRTSANLPSAVRWLVEECPVVMFQDPIDLPW